VVGAGPFPRAHAHPRAWRFLLADHDPLGSLRRAGFSHEEIHRIGELNPRAIFRLG